MTHEDIPSADELDACEHYGADVISYENGTIVSLSSKALDHLLTLT